MPPLLCFSHRFIAKKRDTFTHTYHLSCGLAADAAIDAVENSAPGVVASLAVVVAAAAAAAIVAATASAHPHLPRTTIF